LAVLVGLAVAVILGYWLGTSQVALVYWVFLAAVTAIVVAGFRQHAWILIFIGWSMTGETGFLPYRLSLRHVSVCFAVIGYLTYAALGKRRGRLHWMALDWILAVNLVWLVITYLRHPVGVQAFGSSMLGGRVYVNIALAVACYWVTTRLPDSPKWVARVPLLILVGMVPGTLLYLLAVLAPGLADRLQLLYAVFSLGVYQEGTSVEFGAGITRLGTGTIGLLLTQVLCAYYPPQTLFNPLRWRSWSLWLGLVGIFLSGFRNHLLIAFAYLGISSWLRHGWRELVLVCGLVTLVFGTVLAGQGRLYRLPLGVQRTLSWLPGEWDPDVLNNVKGSNERWDWWRRIIRNRLIENWWLGDGIGVSFRDLAAVHNNRTGFESTAELVGGFHNGPLTTIRAVGVIGLVLFYTMLVALVVYAIRCVRLCAGTVLYPLAIFIAMGTIWKPIHFTLVFGGYDSDLPQTIMILGLLRLAIRMHEELSRVSLATEIRRQEIAVVTNAQ